MTKKKSTTVSGVYLGNQSTADVVPDTEYCSGRCSKGIGCKMHYCKAGGQSRILHSHLNAYRSTFGHGKMGGTGYQIAKKQPHSIVYYHDKQNRCTV